MLTICLAECAHLTITVSQIERDIGRKSSFSHSPRAFDTPVRGFPTSRRYSATPFGTEKLEWFGYLTVKKFRRYHYSFWRDPRTWRTDRHRVTAYTALMHMHRAVKTAESNRQYSNTVIGTLAVDGWPVTFGTARRGLGRSVLSPLY